jgi:hypothetical protein
MDGYFRGGNVTGLVEQQFGPERTAILLIASGSPCMAYKLEGGEAKSIPLAEFSISNGEASHLRAIKLPDVAARLTWLRLELQSGKMVSIMGDKDWEAQLHQWKQNQWTGLAEVSTPTLHGFVFVWQGEIQKSDIAFSTPQGFSTDIPYIESDTAWEVTLYVDNPSLQSYQSAILRHGAMHWSRHLLDRYQLMVGQKLLQTLDRELNRQVKPWKWNILFDENNMVDTHFFPYLMDAAYAYRDLFMTMGVQMSFVIGNNLTQKLLGESFEQLHPDERSILQSQRLIPAAFSE